MNSHDYDQSYVPHANMYANYASYRINDKGEIYGATNARGKSFLFDAKQGEKIKNELVKRYEQQQQEPTTVEQRLAELEKWKEEQLVKNQIEVDGSYDGTNIPVRVNGIRRKIATVAP